MNKLELIEEFSDLINIPQFYKIIVHKINELKLMFSDEIASYLDIKESISRDIRNKKKSYDTRHVDHSEIYKFELFLSEDGRWIPSKFEPPIPNNLDPYTIIPLEVIRHISQYTPDPSRIEKVKKVLKDKTGKKIYEISFSRFSHHFIIGVICEVSEINRSYKKTEKKIININESYTLSSDERSYSELIKNMERYPELKNHIFAEYEAKCNELNKCTKEESKPKKEMNIFPQTRQ